MNWCSALTTLNEIICHLYYFYMDYSNNFYMKEDTSKTLILTLIVFLIQNESFE